MAKTMQANEMLSMKVPANTLRYVGSRLLRHKGEPTDRDKLREETPEAYPHTFVNFGGASIGALMEHAGGKDSSVVDQQKVIRKAPLGDVLAKRRHDNTDSFVDWVLEHTIDTSDFTEEVLEDIRRGAPIYVIDFHTSNADLDIPLTPEDKLTELASDPEIFEPLFGGMNREEQLARVDRIYDSLRAMVQKA